MSGLTILRHRKRRMKINLTSGWTSIRRVGVGLRLVSPDQVRGGPAALDRNLGSAQEVHRSQRGQRRRSSSCRPTSPGHLDSLFKISVGNILWLAAENIVRWEVASSNFTIFCEGISQTIIIMMRHIGPNFNVDSFFRCDTRIVRGCVTVLGGGVSVFHKISYESWRQKAGISR